MTLPAGKRSIELRRITNELNDIVSTAEYMLFGEMEKQMLTVYKIYSNTFVTLDSMKFFEWNQTDDCRDDALFQMANIDLLANRNLKECFDKEITGFLSHVNVNKLVRKKICFSPRPYAAKQR